MKFKEIKITESLNRRFLKGCPPFEDANGCMLWTKGIFKGSGYGAIDKLKAHRVAYVICYGSIPPGKVVMHTCDNPRCVTPSHLVLGTQGDNLEDCIRKRRGKQMLRETCHMVQHPEDVKRGEQNARAKLTVDLVRIIRRSWSFGVPIAYLAKEYGVSATQIRKIIRRKAWTHVSEC